jgi:hypothetical protein
MRGRAVVFESSGGVARLQLQRRLRAPRAMDRKRNPELLEKFFVIAGDFDVAVDQGEGKSDGSPALHFSLIAF